MLDEICNLAYSRPSGSGIVCRGLKPSDTLDIMNEGWGRYSKGYTYQVDGRYMVPSVTDLLDEHRDQNTWGWATQPQKYEGYVERSSCEFIGAMASNLQPYGKELLPLLGHYTGAWFSTRVCGMVPATKKLGFRCSCEFL